MMNYFNFQRDPEKVKDFLEEKFQQFNSLDFIKDDPIVIPHLFKEKKDIEIAAFFAATLAWGKRITIIEKCKQLMQFMDYAPYEFVSGHTENDLKKILGFKHRTFTATDTLYFIEFFKNFYLQHESIEEAFLNENYLQEETLETGIIEFQKVFFNLEYAPHRTRKHVSTPSNNSACKRLNMFLRWMVRKDDKGVDFGIWSKLKPSQLLIPCDVHVDRVARSLGLIQRKQTDWKTALELTANLRTMDLNDPVKYDFALFGLGAIEKN